MSPPDTSPQSTAAKTAYDAAVEEIACALENADCHLDFDEEKFWDLENIPPEISKNCNL